MPGHPGLPYAAYFIANVSLHKEILAQITAFDYHNLLFDHFIVFEFTAA